MSFKILLQEMENKFNEVVLQDIDDADEYYVEVSVRDARKAMTAANDDLFIRRAIRDNFLNMDGTNVYKSDQQNIIEELLQLFKRWDIEVIDSHVGDLDEMSTTAGVPGYLTPNAFGHEAPESAITAFGMKKASMKNKNTKALQESVYKRIMNL